MRELHNMHPHLYRAATQGDLPLLQQEIGNHELLQQISSTKQNTVLHLVASWATADFLQRIHDNCPQLIGKKNLNDDTAVHTAARAGNVDSVTFLIKWAEEVAETTAEEQRETANVLLREQNKEGNTPLLEAVRGEHVDLTLMLLAKDPRAASIANRRRESPLYLAAGLSSGRKLIEKILSLPSEYMDEGIVYGGPNGRTPLHSAVMAGSKEEGNIRLLLDKKEELISKGDDEGKTPLHYAVLFDSDYYVRLLLWANTSSACRHDRKGVYPIHLAASEGHGYMILLLLVYCPESRELLNREGQNALHVAAMKGRKDVITFMLDEPMFEMMIYEKDKKGNTPLHVATIHSRPKIVSILKADQRVDMSAKNNEGLTPLDIAEKYTDEPISLPKLLTLLAFRIAGATLRPGRLVNGKNLQRENPKPEYYKERFSTLVVVATLIATVTFAAGFTIPGGYINDGPYQGTATMLKKVAFQVFVISNTVAMYLSIIVVVNHIAAQLADSRLLILALNMSLVQLGIALIMMAVAFAAGMFVVTVRLLWLAVAVLLMGYIFFLYILALLILFMVPAWSKYGFLRFISKCGFHILMFTFGKFLSTWMEDPIDSEMGEFGEVGQAKLTEVSIDSGKGE